MKMISRKIFSFMLAVTLLLSAAQMMAMGEDGAREITILFTSDIHSYFEPYSAVIEDSVREHGGAGRLKTLIEANSDDHTIVVDAGDFAMGTLLQAGYTTDAYELRLLGLAGCDVTTFGNHEFDFGGAGAAKMLNAAKRSGDPLPRVLIPANLKYGDTMTGEQIELKNALDDIGAERYIIREINGVRVAFFGLLGKDAINCAPTSGVEWEDPITAAKAIVDTIGDSADVIICVSHSGTNGDGKSGEDMDLVKKVPRINAVVSGHSHVIYHDPVQVNGSVLGSPGEYLAFIGKMTLSVDANGKVECAGYELIPCDENVIGDAQLEEKVAGFREEINTNFLTEPDINYDTVIARSEFALEPVAEMYKANDEYTMGELIADAYQYVCAREGIDIDVALVALGTIRGSIAEGDITVANAFEMCSLGMGVDGSAGHPLIIARLYGSELRLLAELDALVCGFMPSVRMSYSGLNFTWYPNRMLLDRVKDLCIERADGTLEPVKDDQLYNCAVNQYAANMLEGLLKMSKGIVKIVPKDADGKPLDLSNISAYAARKADGGEIKEWIALRDFLGSFEKKNGVPTVPDHYRSKLNRKRAETAAGFGIIRAPGTSTIIALAVIALAVVVIVTLIATRKKRRARRAARRANRK